MWEESRTDLLANTGPAYIFAVSDVVCKILWLHLQSSKGKCYKVPVSFSVTLSFVPEGNRETVVLV